MRRLIFVVSLISKDNDYQREQAKCAEDAARQCGVDLRIIYAENDAINQSQQLLKCIQTDSERPDAIVLEPVGTPLPQVARAAVKAGVGWAVLNREVDYMSELRRPNGPPVFQVTPDQVEIGRITGKQVGALFPGGGCVLYIQGPTSSSAAQQRAEGFMQTKPGNIQVRMMRGAWTEESGYKAISSWLRLSTSHEVPIQALISQNDVMAIGARNAIKEQATGLERERWMAMPFLGCDGLPDTGQAWVRIGSLTATVCVPPTAAEGLSMMTRALQTGVMPPERTITPSKSFPNLEMLKPRPAATAK